MAQIKKTYKYFDLETFEEKQVEKTIDFEPAKDLAEAQSRVGGDESTLLKALNSFLRSEALRQAESEATAQGGKKSAVMAVVKPFRAFPPFNAIFKLNADGSPIVENGEKVIDRKAQTKAILEMVKKSPEMIESIKAGSAVETDDTGDNDGDEN